MELEKLRQLITHYEPNKRVLNNIRQIELLGTIGISAAGKSTVTNKAIKKWPAIQLVLSDVSRPARPGEIDGKDYYFRPKLEMVDNLVARNFVQIAPPTPKGDLYATSPESYPKEGIATLAIYSSAVKKFRELPFKEQNYAYIVPASSKRWEEQFSQQATSSGWSLEDKRIRRAEALQSLHYALDEKNSFLSFVFNDDLDRASNRLIQVAKGQLPDEHAKARSIAEEIKQNLKAELG